MNRIAIDTNTQYRRSMDEPLHPSQLPDDWADQVARAYTVFALGKETLKVLRDPHTGMYYRRRNTPEVMRNAPSPYRPPKVIHPAPLPNLIRLDGLGLPADIYERLPEFLEQRPGPATGRWNRETMRTILDARGKPDMPVTVFRPVPWIIKQFMPDDTVVLSPSYADKTADSRPKWRVITGTVPARELFTTSDDNLMRWQWRGKAPLLNGGVVTHQIPRGRR